ncbi:MAG: hypothetical protein F4X83_01200 [Chloroflexi bacterium]|nr:hypothetical protein [Chloroflexota bacterium]
MTLSEFRESLRKELFDPADDEARFSDTDLDHAIDRALTELSRAVPWTRDATLTTSPDSRLVDLSSLADVWSVEEVEWPTGHYPPKLCTFMVLPTSDGAPGFVFLLVPEAPSGAEPMRVRWGTKHVASDSQWTAPDAYTGLLTTGAYAHACLAYATPQSDNFRYQDGQQGAGVDTSMVSQAWWEKGTAARDRFEKELDALQQERTQHVRGSVAWTVEGSEGAR